MSEQEGQRGISRRGFLAVAAATGFALTQSRWTSAEDRPFALRYSLASCMYGSLPLAEILPEVHKTGADNIDLWPARHGNQREEMEEMGVEAFLALCQEHDVRASMITRYDLGPFKVQDEMAVAEKIGADLIVTGSRGTVEDEKAGAKAFVEDLKPHLEVAAKHGVRLGIENHGNALVNSPDSIRYVADGLDPEQAGIALAPYHLPQDPELIAELIRDLGPRLIHFYAWEHGHGSRDPLPKALEMQQMPGYGPLDYGPILAALRDIDYKGLTTVFMHPVPRGIPILPTAAETTAAINRSREYLDWKLAHGAA